MALPDYTTQTAAQYKANIDKSIALTGALVYRTTSQTITTSTATPIQYDNESYDDDTIHDNATNNSRLTVPTGVIKVRLSGLVTFALNTTGYRRARIIKNGQEKVGLPSSVIDAATIAMGMPLVSAAVDVVAGDYFELEVFHTVGSDLGLLGGVGQTNWFCMEIIG